MDSMNYRQLRFKAVFLKDDHTELTLGYPGIV